MYLSLLGPIGEPPKLSDHEQRQAEICLQLAYADYLAWHSGAIQPKLGEPMMVGLSRPAK